MVSKKELSDQELKIFLDSRVKMYNTETFVPGDPVSIPHAFSAKQDIEISGFLTALISWGRRPMIILKAKQLMHLMDSEPHAFLTQSSDVAFKNFLGFVYRTFQGEDALFFISALRHLYLEEGGLETIVTDGFNRGGNIQASIGYLRKKFLRYEHLDRSVKHLPDSQRGSAAKRMNMYLRWMVRNDSSGVDFGLWNSIPASALMCPLDVHSGRVARKLGLLERRLDDWKAVVELTNNLRKFDPSDPVKYDFALFGLGVFEKF